MRDWALLIEYDGSAFCGWQRQADVVTVQAVLEAAVSRLTGAPATAHVAGRTDTGVHAVGQVARVALPPNFQARQVCSALNYHMRPHPVAVLRCCCALLSGR